MKFFMTQILMLNQKKILIAMPAKNEEDRIETTIRSIASYGDLYLFDNNSTDSTSEIAVQLGVQVIHSSKPGYEAVVYHICEFFLESDYEVLVIIDGDGEVGLNELPDSFLKLPNVDGVIGNRNFKKRWAERLVCGIFFQKTAIKDITCGFKILKRAAISKNLKYGTFATGLLDKSASFENIDVCVNPRVGSRLGNEYMVQIKILFCGLRGYYVK